MRGCLKAAGQVCVRVVWAMVKIECEGVSVRVLMRGCESLRV